MNRVLRRPMFKMGGEAEGITSGLNRKPLSTGSDPYDRAIKTTDRFEQDMDRYREQDNRFSPSALPGFLTSFGLNLLSQTPTGNIFQTAATAAKDPFKTFQAATLANRKDRQSRIDDIFSTALASEYDLDREKIEAAGNNDLKTPEIEAKLIKEAQQNIFDARDILKKPDLSDEEKIAAERKIVLNQNVLQKELGVPAEYQAIITSEELFDTYKNSYVEKENNKRIKEYKDKNKDATAEDIATNVTLIDVDSPEAADFTIDELNKRYGYAVGGRVGYKFGTEPKMMEEVAEQPRGEVQDLSYTELRSRLPQEVSNDIVQLLSQSKQALLDFANIQTAEDIASFNQQYQVNLTLPQGA